jgi:hypothetical protein
MATFEAESKQKPSRKNRLYLILMSESAYLIWKLRNERAISKNGTPHSTGYSRDSEPLVPLNKY